MKRQLLLSLLLLVNAPLLQAQVSSQTEGLAAPASLDQREKIVIKHGSAQTYLNRGLIRSAAGNWDAAISDFNKVIEIDRETLPPTIIVAMFGKL